MRLFLFLRGGVATAGSGRAELLKWTRGKATTWELGGQRIEMERSGDAQVPAERAGRRARLDLANMVGVARALGIPILLVTYPYEDFDYANDAARAVARASDVALVDTIADRDRAVADGYTLDDLIVEAAGPDPRGPLYGYITDSMLPAVLSVRPPQ